MKLLFGIGFVAFLLGACAMDSANQCLPIIMVVSGLCAMYIGADMGGRKNGR